MVKVLSCIRSMNRFVFLIFLLLYKDVIECDVEDEQTF